MDPYRISALKENKIKQYKKPFKIKNYIRNLYRRFLILLDGKFKDRYPIKCPCGKKSWDPNKSGGTSRGALYRMNYYRCGQKHDRLHYYLT